MATVGEGNKTALVIIDVQVGVMEYKWEAARIISNIALLVERARTEHILVIWVQHSDDELLQGSPQWKWVPELVPVSDELQIHKHFNSAFEQTHLEAKLADLGVSHLIVAGAATNWCIRATIYAALERGYDVTLVSDAHTTDMILLEGVGVIKAESIIQEFNFVLPWLSYLGRQSKVVSTQELKFY